MNSKAAIFLDRDNTIIHNDGDLGDPNDVVLISDAAAALSQLHAAGWPLIVITNQGGVARGKYDENAVRSVHARIADLLEPTPILDWLWCPWHPEGCVEAYRREHPWRKPAPGMLLEAAQRHNLDLSASWMIGDQDRDVAAGTSAGCRTIKIGTASSNPPSTHTVQNMTDAATIILKASTACSPGTMRDVSVSSCRLGLATSAWPHPHCI